jgi:hypothetical protein
MCSSTYQSERKLVVSRRPGVYIKYIYIYRMSQEECARLWEGVPYGKVYRYNSKHLCPKLNGYRDNGQRKVCSSNVAYNISNKFHVCII